VWLNAFEVTYPCPCVGRCTALTPRLCCDFCQPGDPFFSLFEVPKTPTRPRGKRRIQTDFFELSALDEQLRDKLNKWRKQKLVDEGMDDGFYGSQLILPNGVRDRIIALVHHNKLDQIETLFEQTKWNGAIKYGPEIWDIYMQIYRPPSPAPDLPTPSHLASTPFTSTPLLRLPLSEVSTPTPNHTMSTTLQKRQYHCQACKAAGLDGAGHSTSKHIIGCPLELVHTN
jgi:hypothetical protein